MPNFRSVRKATAEEKEAYWSTQPVYPLHGYIYMESDEGPVEVFVEDLRGNWSRPDPVWEIVFPKGFNAGECHSLLCTDMEDLKQRAGEYLTRCTHECHCDYEEYPS